MSRPAIPYIKQLKMESMSLDRNILPATPKMLLKNMACKDFPKQLAGKCKLQHNWVSEKICQRSCYEAGNGYDGDECCPAETTGTAIDGVPSESTSDPVNR